MKIDYTEEYLKDRLCKGDYEIKITIFAENGKPTSKKFILKVDEVFENLRLEEL